jgi:hypothetical protein
MSRGQYYAGVLTRLAMQPQPDPHPASAAVSIKGVTFCSSILPWAGKDDPRVWGDGNQGERTRTAVRSLAAALAPTRSVWGGDFNHAIDGPLTWSGSAVGRAQIDGLIAVGELTMPTARLPHRRPGSLSIDHVGTPHDWTIIDASRIEVAAALSDHDAYVVTAEPA